MPSWTAEILRTPPLIAPARHFIYPHNIPGEEDALARGALNVLVKPTHGSAYLLTCALGFNDPAMPTALHKCPNPDELCAVAGGYAYLSNTLHPETCTLLPIKPVVDVLQAPGLLLFAGFHTILAWGSDGVRWQTAKLTSEGITVTSITETEIHGTGWDLISDKDVPFTINLLTGNHSGGLSIR